MIKKRIILICLTLLLATTLAACRFEVTRSPSGDAAATWITSGLTNDEGDNSWSISSERISGNTMREVSITSEELAAFSIESTFRSGKITITLTQENAEMEIDVPDGYQEVLDVSDKFEPGDLQILLSFEDAEDITLSLEW